MEADLPDKLRQRYELFVKETETMVQKTKAISLDLVKLRCMEQM